MAFYGLTDSSTQAGTGCTDLQLIGSSTWSTAKHWPDTTLFSLTREQVRAWVELSVVKLSLVVDLILMGSFCIFKKTFGIVFIFLFTVVACLVWSEPCWSNEMPIREYVIKLMAWKLIFLLQSTNSQTMLPKYYNERLVCEVSSKSNCRKWQNYVRCAW